MSKRLSSYITVEVALMFVNFIVKPSRAKDPGFTLTFPSAVYSVPLALSQVKAMLAMVLEELTVMVLPG